MSEDRGTSGYKPASEYGGQPSGRGTSGYKPVTSFASYKKVKGKEWKSIVSGTGQEEKKKIYNVAISVGLMEWIEVKKRKEDVFTSVAKYELQCSSQSSRREMEQLPQQFI